jgi:hypothetical protein
MTTVTPIAKDQGIKKNIFEQALDKAKTVITGERTDATAKAKVEPATTQIKSNIKAENPDAYIKPEQANQAPADKPADTSTVKELWNKAVKVIKEDVVKPIETTVKKITGLETDGKLKTEDIKLKLGNTSTVKNADGTDTTINEVASAEQIEAVRAEVSRNANTILSHATANNKAVEQKQRTYAELQSELQTEADKSKTTGKPSYESNIDLSSDDTKVKQRNEEIKQAWANLEANRKMMQEYRDSLTKDKDELTDITAQETEVDKELAEIQKLQENLRQSVGSTVNLTNGAKLTNDGVEDNGKGIRQLNSEELKAKGIKDPEKLLGKDNAFIEYESKNKDGKAIIKQHLVNSKLENNTRVTNITTDAQDLNNDGTIQAEELPSESNKPLEKIIGNFNNNQDLKNLYLSSVQFNGDKAVIPPSAQNRIGDKYSDVYGSIPDGQFKTLQLSKGDTGMTVESLEGNEFWKKYTAENNLSSIIAKNYTVTETEATQGFALKNIKISKGQQKGSERQSFIAYEINPTDEQLKLLRSTSMRRAFTENKDEPYAISKHDLATINKELKQPMYEPVITHLNNGGKLSDILLNSAITRGQLIDTKYTPEINNLRYKALITYITKSENNDGRALIRALQENGEILAPWVDLINDGINTP